MKIVSWNVNSVRMRLQHTLDWLDEHQPDVLCLQETKVKDDLFPAEPFEERGLHVYRYGQPAYNGVALISKEPLLDIQYGFNDGSFEEQKRLIAGTLQGVRIINVYVPNGQSPSSDKFVYKEEWYAALRNMLDSDHNPEENLLICGDFNVAPEDRDVYDPQKLLGTCCFHPLEHEWFKSLLNWGLVDTFRLHSQEAEVYSWWDYRENKFKRNMGLRIDHLLVTQSLAKKCTSSSIDKAPRALEKPSDHVPVFAEFSL